MRGLLTSISNYNAISHALSNKASQTWASFLSSINLRITKIITLFHMLYQTKLPKPEHRSFHRSISELQLWLLLQFLEDRMSRFCKRTEFAFRQINRYTGLKYKAWDIIIMSHALLYFKYVYLYYIHYRFNHWTYLHDYSSRKVVHWFIQKIVIFMYRHVPTWA